LVIPLPTSWHDLATVLSSCHSNLFP
jgi:hypothetical protein